MCVCVCVWTSVTEREGAKLGTKCHQNGQERGISPVYFRRVCLYKREKDGGDGARACFCRVAERLTTVVMNV